jgi:hypothetical protein
MHVLVPSQIWLVAGRLLLFIVLFSIRVGAPCGGRAFWCAGLIQVAEGCSQ